MQRHQTEKFTKQNPHDTGVVKDREVSGRLPRFLAHLTGWIAATFQDSDAQTWSEGHEFSLDKLNLKGWRRQEGSWITRDEVQRQVHNGGSGHRIHGNNEIPPENIMKREM